MLRAQQRSGVRMLEHLVRAAADASRCVFASIKTPADRQDRRRSSRVGTSAGQNAASHQSDVKPSAGELVAVGMIVVSGGLCRNRT